MSTTLTIKSFCATFPLTSDTVSVTVLNPKSAHVNISRDKTNWSVAQLSVVLLSTSITDMVACPLIIGVTTIAFVLITGDMVSNTVISAIAVEKFPLWSVTVRVTVFIPISVQLNADFESDKF